MEFEIDAAGTDASSVSASLINIRGDGSSLIIVHKDQIFYVEFIPAETRQFLIHCVVQHMK